MLYISFDQASGETGFSVFLDSKLVAYGKKKTSHYDFMENVLETEKFMLETIEKYLNEYKPKQYTIALEEIQLQHRGGVDTFKKLAQLQGVLITSIMRNHPDAKLELVYASTWKAFAKVKGNGRAEQKRNAQAKIKELFGKDVTQDEADAILIGYSLAGSQLNWE